MNQSIKKIVKLKKKNFSFFTFSARLIKMTAEFSRSRFTLSWIDSLIRAEIAFISDLQKILPEKFSIQTWRLGLPKQKYILDNFESIDFYFFEPILFESLKYFDK